MDLRSSGQAEVLSEVSLNMMVLIFPILHMYLYLIMLPSKTFFKGVFLTF